ncbi:MAG: response regulator [Cytophagales bacterium]|nr:response regulator [Cytophagales bacterium]
MPGAVCWRGREGLALAQEHLPDLVVSDVMMPGLNGFELCRRLKTDEKTSHIPVVLLTAWDDATNHLTGLETGADHYLAKPFKDQVLLLTVRNLLQLRERIARRHRGELQQMEQMELNSTDKNLFKKGHECAGCELYQPRI